MDNTNDKGLTCDNCGKKVASPVQLISVEGRNLCDQCFKEKSIGTNMDEAPKDNIEDIGLCDVCGKKELSAYLMNLDGKKMCSECIRILLQTESSRKLLVGDKNRKRASASLKKRKKDLDV